MNIRIFAARAFTVLLALGITGCGLFSDAPPHRDYTALLKSADADTIKQWEQSGQEFVVLDVRTEREYKEDGHVDGSVLHPYSFNNKKRGQNERFLETVRKELEPDTTIVVLCGVGMRASQAAFDLQTKAGFTNVYVYGGGFEGHHMEDYPGGEGWKADGLPVED